MFSGNIPQILVTFLFHVPQLIAERFILSTKWPVISSLLVLPRLMGERLRSNDVRRLDRAGLPLFVRIIIRQISTTWRDELTCVACVCQKAGELRGLVKRLPLVQGAGLPEVCLPINISHLIRGEFA